ncbi:hypothetical protein K1719_047443 [Acacia pycnantha]|nr:hypothetical protein K1719_047443 [Acacia pycnantha]
MTEAIVEVALETLSSLIQKQLGLFLGVNGEMKRLSDVLTTIKAVLEDAEEKQLTNKALRNWLRKLRDAAYLLEDILDECSTHALSLEYRHKVQGSCLYSFHPTHVMFRYKIAKKLKDISQRLDEIAEERLRFHLREIAPERRNEVMEWRQTTSIITQPQFYGRDAERDRIVDFLVHDASNSVDVSVYPIVGIGGLGKTTLAQQVFNDERVANHFELKIWVCVSEDFNLKRLSKAVIESAGHTCGDLDLEPLQQRLQEVVGRKDICLSWMMFGMITMRNGTVPPHQLSLLSEDDCWELFKQRAFGPDKKERAELVAIGREIVKKCKGVPLAVKTLGSLLHFKSDEKDWLYIKESEIWNLPQDEYSILPALRLSYLNLPAKLRRCFAFCALFPKDEIISKEFIIELWMAVGLISSNERLEVEDDGDRVWSELYLRSIFEEVETGSFTWFKMHDLIHDLAQSVVGDECCFITRKNMTPIPVERTFHLSYGGLGAFHGQWLSHLHQVKSLKTFIMPGNPRDYDLNDEILNLHFCWHLQKLPNQLNRLKSLRHLHLEELKNLKLEGTLRIKHLERVSSVMDAKEANLAEKRLNELELSWERNEESQSEGNEEQILEVLQPHPQLNHLRIKGYFGTKLPHWMRIPTLKDLTSLELRIVKCFLHFVPEKSSIFEAAEFKNMEHLQYVDDGSYVDGVARAFNLKFLGLRKLPRLQKLSRENGDNMFPCLVTLQIYQCPKLILPCLPSVTTLHMLKECNRALLLSIQNLHNLEELWFFEDKEVLPTELSSLKALQVLRIEECNHLQTLTEEALQGLCSLKKMAIIEYAKFKLSAGFQNLVALEDLTIAGCPKVEDLHESLQHIKGLQSLTLDDLPNLASLPDWLGNLRSLKSLTISRCPKLMSLPTSTQLLNNLKDLKIFACPELVRRCLEKTGDDWHKIAHVPRTHLNEHSVFKAKHGFSSFNLDENKREDGYSYTMGHACSRTREIRDLIEAGKLGILMKTSQS